MGFNIYINVKKLVVGVYGLNNNYLSPYIIITESSIDESLYELNDLPRPLRHYNPFLVSA